MNSGLQQNIALANSYMRTQRISRQLPFPEPRNSESMLSAHRGEVLNKNMSKSIDSVQEERREVLVKAAFTLFYCSLTSVYILLLKS
jgi:transglutaminase/protease-like cytokinesis protein 3